MMIEKELVGLWNEKRSQLIKAQLHSVIALAVLAFLTLTGDLGAATTGEQLFAALFLVTVGALGNLTQFAIIRESYGVVAELSKMKDLGAIATTIAKSGRYLSMTMSVMVLFSVALLGGFALVVF